MAESALTDKPFTVYRITCVPTGKMYVGITSVAVAERWRRHVRYAIWKRRVGALQGAIRKYGETSFAIEAVYEAVNNREAISVERALIAQWGTMWPDGLNLSIGGETRPAYAVSPVTRQRISAVQKGKVLSAETRAKMSASRKGKKATETQLRSLKKGQGSHGPLSSQRRAALQAASKAWRDSVGEPDFALRRWREAGGHKTEEYRQKRRQAALGKKHSEETRRKISAVQKGKALSDQHRRRLAEATTRYHAERKRLGIKHHWEKIRSDVETNVLDE